MDKKYLCISDNGINNFIDNFPSERDVIKFPNVSVKYFGELISKYFSFSGFYEIKKVSDKYIDLKKLEKPVSPDFEKLNLDFRHTSFLQTYANTGVSFLKGKFNSKDLEGTIKKVDFRTYQIYITKSE